MNTEAIQAVLDAVNSLVAQYEAKLSEERRKHYVALVRTLDERDAALREAERLRDVVLVQDSALRDAQLNYAEATYTARRAVVDAVAQRDRMLVAIIEWQEARVEVDGTGDGTVVDDGRRESRFVAAMAALDAALADASAPGGV